MANRQFDQSRTPTARKFLMRRRRKPIVGPTTAISDPPTAAMPQPSSETMIPVQTDTPNPHSQPRRRDWGWPLIWLSVLLVFGGTAAGAFFWLITMPPPINCENISPLSPDMERLQCAQQAAASRKVDQLVKGLALVKDWPAEHPLYGQATHMRDEWSLSLLEIAQNKMDGGDLKGAISIAGNVPKNSPVYADAQALVALWQQDWDKGKVLYNKAIEAIKTQQWQQATAYAQQMVRLRNDYWGQQRYGELLKQIVAERQAWGQLKEARELATYETPDELEKALSLVRKIGSNSYAYTLAKADIVKWSRKLLDLAAKRLQARDLDGAISIAKRVPQESSLYAEAQDFVLLSRAEILVPNTKNGPQQPAATIVAVLEAQAAARQIGPDRPLYKQAQAKITDWQAQLKDLLQLQMASSLASVGQGLTFQLAIDQAQMVKQERPRRIYAQTLIAQWRKQLEQSQDRPYVVLAQQLAESGTIDALKAAITKAREVTLGRPLRIEAQTLIASWNKQIQTLEDQPILDQARTVAKQGNLSNAIRIAEKIGQGRALYKQARTSIDEWVGQIQIAEDRPKLNEATKLAAQGRLTDAIQVASQIGSGRALYYEAQDGIGRWAAERDAIRAAQQPAAPAQETYPAESYSPPAQEYYPPAEPYNPPAQNYAPPAEPYNPPAQNYAPPAEPYNPPAEAYVAPAEPYNPPAEAYVPPEEPYVPPVESYSPPPEEPYVPPAEPPAAAPPPAEPPATEPLPIDGIE
ncbi:hypothetical protein [Microcoleus sp. FACHB-672]|uniref:hypothetical protein n=1 Tax=Microcoleus sp. FACHB-672 TaxID=2692825 RepID=UPI001686AC60|nr:hypothetical protein [Microcoleus sp. FACHB-672]MBD2040540.1 hypothetical protein [Microcoleus sp. FACHB-672]